MQINKQETTTNYSNRGCDRCGSSCIIFGRRV